MSVADTEMSTLSLFEGCTPEDLVRLSAAVTGIRQVPEGTVLCREGDPADRWWMVVDGIAEVTVEGLFVATIGPGESIGELALLDGQPRDATVTARTDLAVQEVDGGGFLEALFQSPSLTLALLQEVAVRLRRANDLSTGRRRGRAGAPPPRPPPARLRPPPPRSQMDRPSPSSSIRSPPVTSPIPIRSTPPSDSTSQCISSR
jgi:CRP-like cAMP-binding protein